MQIEIIETGQRLSEQDWYARNPTIAFPRPLTDQVLQDAHASFPAIPPARIVPAEPQPAPVPQSCTRRQGRLALLAAGHLDDVEQAIAAIADDTERRAAQIEYEADTWERGNAFVQQMWATLGGTPAQLDDLFRMAVDL